MEAITKEYQAGTLEGLQTNKENIITVTSIADSLRLAESNFSNAVHVSVGELKLTLKTDNTYRVDGRGGVLTNAIEIPSSFNNSPITEIASGAFTGDANLTIVNIPLSVTKIGSSAFYGCTNLTKVTIADEDYMTIFFKAPALDGWGAPLAKVSYENDGEYNTQKMTLVDSYNKVYACSLPLNVYNIGFTQGGDDGMETSVISISTDNPSTRVFTATPIKDEEGNIIDYKLEYLDDNYVPPICFNRLEIGTTAFRGCTSLKSITLPRRTGLLGTGVFRECTALESVQLLPHHGVAKIPHETFLNCEALTTAVLENGVREVGNKAFSGCTNLYTTVLGPTITTIGDEAFRNCYEMGMFTIPASVKTIGMGAFGWDNQPNSRYIYFADEYTWFVSDQKTVDVSNLTLLHPTALKDGATGTQSAAALNNGRRLTLTTEGNYADKYWHQLKQMPAPKLSLNNGMLSMTDPLGYAEEFKIYVGGKHKATVYVTEQ